MNVDKPLSFSLRVFLGLAALAIVLYAMIQAATIINALLLSYIIVLSASPILYWLIKKNVPSWLAFILTLLAIVVVILILAVMLVVTFAALSESLPEYANEMDEAVASIELFFIDLGIDPDDVKAAIEGIPAALQPEEIVDFTLSFLGSIVSAFSNVFLVGLIVIFLLVDVFTIQDKLSSEIQKGNEYMQRIALFGADIREYVYITTIVGLFTGVVDTVLFVILGVPFPILWGILAFLFSYVPTLGFWIAAIPPTLLAFLEYGAARAIIVFLGIVIINGAAENLVKPRYMGKGLNLSPFVVVFSVVFWSKILGPMGAILSIPMTLIFKELIFEADSQNSWIGTLMSAGISAVAPERLDEGELETENQAKEDNEESD